MTLFAAIDPSTARNVLLILIGGCYLGYHIAHLWRRWRAKAKEAISDKAEEKVEIADQGQERNSPTDSEGTAGASVPSAPQLKSNARDVDAAKAVGSEVRPCNSTAQQEKAALFSPSPSTFAAPSATPAISLSGEELYVRARAIPHQEIPDPGMDGKYLGLLGQSSEKGFALASMKLGDYAMRRGTWVEAYYWMTLAKRQGMRDLDGVMREIRKRWALEDFPNESGNVDNIFTEEAGSIGRALLGIDTRHDAYAAREFLKSHHPEFL